MAARTMHPMTRIMTKITGISEKENVIFFCELFNTVAAVRTFVAGNVDIDNLARGTVASDVRHIFADCQT